MIDKSTETNKTKTSVAEIVANTFKESIQKSIETGEKPIWTKGFWNANVFNFTRPDYKYKPYNLILLSGFLADKTPCFGTFKQWKNLNVNKRSKEDENKPIHIKKGGRGGLIIGFVPYYKVLETKDKEKKERLERFIEENKYKQNHKELFKPYIVNGEIGMYMGLKCNTIFSIDDVENLSKEFKDKIQSVLEKNKKEKEKTFSENDTQRADKIVKAYAESQGIEIKNIYSADCAYYSREENEIVLPLKEQYMDDGMYYKTLFHELGHSTNKENKRDIKDYAKEELVAEFTACALMDLCGLKMNGLENNSLSYIEGWGKSIKSDVNRDKKEIENKTDIEMVQDMFNTIDGKSLVFCLIEAEKAVNAIMEKYNEKERTEEQENDNIKEEIQDKEIGR